MTRHIFLFLYCSLYFSFLSMSSAIIELGSCYCFLAFSASCASCNSPSSLCPCPWRGTAVAGSQQPHLPSCIAPNGRCPWQAVTSSKRKEKPILLRDQKTTEAEEIRKRHFKILVLSRGFWKCSCLLGRPRSAASDSRKPSYLPASQAAYHGHSLGYIVYFRVNK